MNSKADPHSDEFTDLEFPNIPQARHAVTRPRLLAAILLPVLLLAAASYLIFVVYGETLSEKDQMTFAISLEQAANQGDIDGFKALIDWNRLREKAISGISATVPRPSQSCIEQATSDPEFQRGTHARRAVQTVKEGGSFKFLRLGSLNGEPVALFRTIKAILQIVNYDQYFLKRSKDGRIRAYDLYLFSGSERFSESLRK